MMNISWKIVFMGTPDFSVPTLKALYQTNNQIALVVTQPDRPKGRGRTVYPTPVKKAALELGLDVVQPESIRTEAFENQIRALNPDAFVVLAFGHILPQSLLKVPKYGAINVHGSLLPKLRGPAPIQWAIINGEKQTGVTTMQMDAGMDTGDILLQQTMDILPDDTAGSLHDRMAPIGADLLVNTLEGLQQGLITPMAQDHSKATYAPMLKKEDGRIDWNQSAEAIEAFIRGMSPWPGAYTFIGNKRFKIYQAVPVPKPAEATPGVVVQGFPDELWVATGDGILSIREIQGASGKRLPVEAFLRGTPLEPGVQFT